MLSARFLYFVDPVLKVTTNTTDTGQSSVLVAQQKHSSAMMGLTRLKSPKRKTAWPCTLDDSTKLWVRRLDPRGNDFEILSIVGGYEASKIGSVVQSVRVHRGPIVRI